MLHDPAPSGCGRSSSICDASSDPSMGVMFLGVMSELRISRPPTPTGGGRSGGRRAHRSLSFGPQHIVLYQREGDLARAFAAKTGNALSVDRSALWVSAARCWSTSRIGRLRSIGRHDGIYAVGLWSREALFAPPRRYASYGFLADRLVVDRRPVLKAAT